MTTRPRQEARSWLESDGDGSILYLLPDFTLSLP